MQELSYSLQDIDTAAATFFSLIGDYRLLTFKGSMGAGKTTFISALCRHMGIKDAVSSPTFALVNEYRCNLEGKPSRVFHIDLYRLRDEEEAVHAGMEDCFLQALRGEAYCFVEWPERAPNLLRTKGLEARISLVSETERIMTLKPLP